MGENFSTTPIIIKVQNAGKTCKECSEPAVRLGLCITHYMQQPAQRERKAKWYQENQALTITRALAWEKNNPESRAATNAQRRSNAYKTMDALDRGISRDYRKAIRNDTCFYCGTTSAKKWHFDHYISLHNGGTDHWWNIVHACGSCNYRKNKKNGDEFLATMKEAPILAR